MTWECISYLPIRDICTVLDFARFSQETQYRQCVILRVVEERPHREIAELLGINEKNVSMYVKRGLDKLRQVLTQENKLNERTIERHIGS